MSAFSSPPMRWAQLALCSLLLAALLRLASFPAALLLGPMLAATFFAMRGSGLRLPQPMFTLAKATIGCMVARAITASTLTTVVQDWRVMLVAVFAIVLSGALVGLTLLRFGSLPGGTAAWGTTPGGAAAMTAMAQAYGADVRLVAFMQYLRMIVVVLTASVVARFLPGNATLAVHSAWTVGFFTPWQPTLLTLLLIGGTILLSRWVPIPTASLLLPMFGGAVLNSTGLLTITLPSWILWIAYASLGWYVGLRFTPEMVRYALRAIPQMLLATFMLIALCFGAGLILMRFLGVDMLTGYLATSPGGLDTVTAIALSSHCDVSFVMAMQALRLFAVVIAGPPIARLICRLGRTG